MSDEGAGIGKRWVGLNKVLFFFFAPEWINKVVCLSLHISTVDFTATYFGQLHFVERDFAVFGSKKWGGKTKREVLLIQVQVEKRDLAGRRARGGKNTSSVPRRRGCYMM